MTGSKQSVLGPLGVRADEERVYRALLASPGSSLAELAAQLAYGPHRLRRCLAELERKAMITRRAGVPSRYQPVPPDIVVDALISSREDELSRARLEAHELTTLLRKPAAQLQVTDLVEILTSRDAAVERWFQLQRVTRERLEVLVRPPWGQFEVGSEEEVLQRSLIDSGVAVTGIYDEGALRHPGVLDHMRRMTGYGERVRVVGQLPLKLALFDRRVALVPVAQPDPAGGVDGGLVVHESALLDALVALFDLYWQRAADVRLAGTPGAAAATEPPAADEQEVLTLLAGGLKDAAIAHQLGVSTSTVRRRITALLARRGVTTRFQAGLLLGRQGW